MVDRRSLLATAAGLLVPALATAVAAPVDRRVAVDVDSGESMILARHISQADATSLPSSAVRAATCSILDAIGVSLAASGLEPACRPFIELALAQEAPRGSAQASTVVGTGRRAPLLLAALANGSLAHALDYEDAHEASRTHPNATPIAVALSLADALGGISGRDFLVAIAIGSDLTCRLSMAQGNVGDLPTAFYPPAIAGTIGATATAARLLKLGPHQVLDAMSMALCQNSCSAEILSDAYSDLRAVRDGFSAQVAVQSALLAAGGVRGFSRPIEGPRAFFAMFSQSRCVPGILTKELGEFYEGANVGYKAWPACRDVHPYIQSALEGAQREGISASQVARIRAKVTEGGLIVCEPITQKRRPRAAIDAKFSLYYTVAAALVDRGVTLATYSTAALSRPEVLALADRIDYVVAGQGARGAGESLLEVELTDGSTREWGIQALYGSPENPMDEEALVAKFDDCARLARCPATPPRIKSLAARLLALGSVPDMRAITRAL